jgi:hypothetical protein
MPSARPPSKSDSADTNAALRITGSERPTKSGKRPAGVTRTYPSVCWKRSPVIVNVIAKRHGTDAYWSALPTT